MLCIQSFIHCSTVQHTSSRISSDQASNHPEPLRTRQRAPGIPNFLRMRVYMRFNSFFTVVSRVPKKKGKVEIAAPRRQINVSWRTTKMAEGGTAEREPATILTVRNHPTLCTGIIPVRPSLFTIRRPSPQERSILRPRLL